MASSVTIALDDDGNLFVDAASTDEDSISLAEALGILELAKDVLIRGEA